jgi:hypothetical protein
MIQLIAGIILLAIPFILLDIFLDKKKGFIYVLFFLLLFHTILAVLTQASGIFYYWLVLAISALADLVLLVFYFRARNKKKLPFRFPKIDWILLIVVAIACLTLCQVHYNYTGKINLATDKLVSYHEVKNMEYIYPYFSDEWYAVSLIKHSINSHSLPVINILDNSFFLNLEMFFHSLTAEAMLLLGLNPLTQYILVSILINILIIVLAYIFLRINNISKPVSAICSLSILYIACGANLPGIWHLIPVHSGIVFSLIGFCFMASDNFIMAALSSLPVIFFYPPLFVFYGLALLVFFISRFRKIIKKHVEATIYAIIVILLALPVVYIILLISPLSDFTKYIFSRVFYTSFYGPNITNINFYNIIPWPIILLALIGLPQVFKTKKWLFSAFLLGAVFWFFYSFTINRFVIEYERVVFFMSIIVAIISGFGLVRLEDYLKQKYKNFGPISLKYAEITAIILFLGLAPFYTQRENWATITLVNIFNGVKSYPKAPVNNYLTKDDLRIFKDIKNKKFLSTPWKGTVIGVATENYPVSTKQGTISVGDEKTVDIFLSSNCDGKKSIAKKYNLDYVYIDDFNCPGFEKIDNSEEGLILYKVP